VINVPPWPSASGLELAADKPPTAARPIKMRFGHDHRGAHRFQLRGRAPGTTFEVRDGAWYATHKNRTQLRPLRLFRGNVPTPRAGGGRLSTLHSHSCRQAALWARLGASARRAHWLSRYAGVGGNPMRPAAATSIWQASVFIFKMSDC
jgi:hypothetical protein